MALEGDIREEHQRVTQECTPESPLFRPREDSESYQRSFREHVRAIFPNKGFPKFPWNACFCCWQPPSVRCLLMPPSVLHITFLSLPQPVQLFLHFVTKVHTQVHNYTQVHKYRFTQVCMSYHLSQPQPVQPFTFCHPSAAKAPICWWPMPSLWNCSRTTAAL